MVLHFLPFVFFFYFFFIGVVVMTFLTKYTLIHKISKTSLFVFVFLFLSLSYIWERHIWNAFLLLQCWNECCPWNFNVTIMGTKVVELFTIKILFLICIIEKKNSFNLYELNATTLDYWKKVAVRNWNNCDIWTIYI